MRIIAESRPVTAMPFVHLGYLAASYFRPVAGFTLTGTILAVAGIAMALKLVRERSKRGKLWTYVRCRTSRMGAIGLGAVLVGIACAAVGWIAGERYYPHGESTTSMQMRMALREIDWRVCNPLADETTKRRSLVAHLPAEAGVYDLVSMLQGGPADYRSRDGWRNPMKLKVVVADGRKPAYILLSAGRDRKWGTEDDRTSEGRLEGWRKSWREEAAQAEAARASREDGQPK